MKFNFEKILKKESSEEILEKKDLSLEEKEKIFEEIKKEIVDVFEIFKAQNKDLTQNSEEKFQEIFSEAEKVLHKEGKLTPSPDEVAGRAKEFFIARLKALVEDIHKDKKANKQDAVNAKLALVYFDEFKPEYGIDFPKFIKYLKKETEEPFISEKAFEIVVLKENKDNNFAYDFSRDNNDKYLEGISEETLLKIHKKGSWNSEKAMLQRGSVVGKYSEKLFKDCLRDSTRIILDYWDKFENKDITKIVDAVGWKRDQSSAEYIIAEILENPKISEDDKQKALNRVAHQFEILTDRGETKEQLVKYVPDFEENFNKKTPVEEDGNTIKIPEENYEIMKEKIKNGYINLIDDYFDKRVLKKIFEKDYDFVLEMVKKYEQEILVLEFLKLEDQKIFIKDQIKNENWHIISQTLNDQNFEKIYDGILDNDDFLKLQSKGFHPESIKMLRIFSGLSEENFENFKEKQDNYQFSESLFKNVKSFNFQNEKYQKEKDYQEFIKSVNDAYDGHADRFYKYFENDFNFDNFDPSKKAELIKYSQEKAESIKRVTEKLYESRFDSEEKFNWAENGTAILDTDTHFQNALSSECLGQKEYDLLKKYNINCFKKIELSFFRNLNEETFNEFLENYEARGAKIDWNRISRVVGYFDLPEDSENLKLFNETKNLTKDQRLQEYYFNKASNMSEAERQKIMGIIKECQVATGDEGRLMILYLEKFENNNDEIEKKKFLTYAEMLNNIKSSNVRNLLVENWDFLYNNFSNLNGAELEKHQKLLSEAGNIYYSGDRFLFGKVRTNFLDFFEKFSSLNEEQQNDMVRLNDMLRHGNIESSNEEDYVKNIFYYINDVEELRRLDKDEKRTLKMQEMFNGQYKDIALDSMNKDWQTFLNSDQKYLPPNLFFLSSVIDQAGGAGNLKHVESLGNLIHEINKVLENPKTANRTKDEIRQLLIMQEKKFNKEKWSQDDRSEFYNLSKDIIEAAPSLYTSFSTIFEKISPKDMKIFVKEVFPFYQAQLVIIQEIQNENINYQPRDLVSVRQGVENLANELDKSPEEIKNAFTQEKNRLLEIVRNSFKERFGLLKVPEVFSKDDLRSIQNGIRYIGNINDRNEEREAIISLFIGLELDGKWSAFRQGADIKIDEYFSSEKLKILKPLIEERSKNYELLSEVGNISKENMGKFQEILQEDTISNIVGNVKTIDVKLGDIKRNIAELTDPDIYPNPKDKEIIRLLAESGKNIGVVLAKTYNEHSGKSVSFNETERSIQSKIANTFEVTNWTTEKVKQIQDEIQPLALVSNMINKMNEEEVDENIALLQERLVPTPKIIEIFNRLGEEFKQESGAMALSKDLAYLESLIIKDSEKITVEEKKVVDEYLSSIKDKMKELEITFDKIREYFNKIKKSSHLENHELLKNRLEDIEKIIYSKDLNAMIISHMTKDLNLIIENMRQCLGCMRKEINNDTNLAFGDYNKFFMINQAEKERDSISDEIVFFVPVKNPGGFEEMSFVMDRVYGSKSADVLIGNILSVFKKYQMMKKEFPNARVSISVSNEAMSSVGLNAEILKNRLNEISQNINTIEVGNNLIADIPKSSFSDNYVEFGNATARQTGERTFSGLIVR